MGESVYQGLTVGDCLALTQFAMVLVLGSGTCARPRTCSTRSPRGGGRALETAENDSGPARFRRAPTRAASTEEERKA